VKVRGIFIVRQRRMGAGIDGVKPAGAVLVVQIEAFEEDAIGGTESTDAVLEVEFMIGRGDDNDIGGVDFGSHGITRDPEGVIGRGKMEQGAG